MECLDVLLPTITQMINLSFNTSTFPEVWKEALLKTTLLKVKNDILMNMNKGHVTLLVLSDLSAAFDTVDHIILLKGLESRIGVSGKALAWFSSYLTNRSQRASINGIVSDSFSLECGVPQGSSLGPLLFNIYVSKLFEIIKVHLPCNVHGFADDTQLYLSFKPDSCVSQEAAVIAMQSCIQDIHCWMLTDRLMLNVDKTEFHILGTRQQLAKVTTNDLTVGQDNISHASEVKNLVGLTVSWTW